MLQSLASAKTTNSFSRSLAITFILVFVFVCLSFCLFLRSRTFCSRDPLEYDNLRLKWQSFLFDEGEAVVGTN